MTFHAVQYRDGDESGSRLLIFDDDEEANLAFALLNENPSFDPIFETMCGIEIIETIRLSDHQPPPGEFMGRRLNIINTRMIIIE